jgi:hypothetical protein
MFVLDRLALLAPTHPLPVLECLRELIKGEHQHWTIMGSETHVRIILTAGLQSNEPAASALAQTIINDLGVIGYTKFRTLLQPAI